MEEDILEIVKTEEGFVILLFNFYSLDFYDKKNGYGEFEWADGKVYKGNWVNGKQHGKGLY